jgi:hypothetical protein
VADSFIGYSANGKVDDENKNTGNIVLLRSSWLWSYCSWIYNYICNQCLSPLKLWVRILIRERCTTLYDKVCQWLATGLWFSPSPPVSSINKTDHHDVTEILEDKKENIMLYINVYMYTNHLIILWIHYYSWDTNYRWFCGWYQTQEIKNTSGRDHMVVWFTTAYVVYYWNTRGSGGRDHMVVWFTATCVIYYCDTRGRLGRDHNHHMITTTTAPCISVIYDICSCKSHHLMITTTTASCILVIYDICSCKSFHINGDMIYNYICHVLLKYKGPSWSWSSVGVIYNYLCHTLLKYKGSLWSW